MLVKQNNGCCGTAVICIIALNSGSLQVNISPFTLLLSKTALGFLFDMCCGNTLEYHINVA